MSTSAAMPTDYRAHWQHYESLPDTRKAVAQRRLAALDALMPLIGTVRLGAAYKAAGEAAGVQPEALRKWHERVKDHPRQHWLALLADHYQGRKKEAECSPEAWDAWKADYLRLEKPLATACYGRLKRAAEKHGWTVPSIATLKRRLEREIATEVRVLLREGQEALKQMYPPQQRRVFDLRALEWINGDGYMHNVFVRWPDGTIHRPKTWFWQDIFSRKLLAFRTDQSEHTDLLRFSLGDLIETYGIPEHCTIDNTRAAANKWLTGGARTRYRFKIREDEPWGIFTTLGVQIHWTSVFNGKGSGQSKPIERAFGGGNVGEVVDKHPAFAGAYTGANPTAKPENYGKKAIPLETFLGVLQQEITAWNARPKRRTETAGGTLSFDDVFERSYTSSVIRACTEEQRRLWLLCAEGVKVKDDATFTLEAGAAVGVGRNRYHSESLYEHRGESVVVRFDPASLHQSVHAYTLDGRYLRECHLIESSGFGDTEAAREHARARKQFIRATKEAAQAEQRITAIEAASLLPGAPPAPPPVAKIIRPHKAAKPVQPIPLDLKVEKLRKELVAESALEAEIIPLQESPAQRYARWCAMDARLKQGDSVSEEQRRWWANYSGTAEWRSQKDMAESFGPAESQAG
jgi:putative transposase